MRAKPTRTRDEVLRGLADWSFRVAKRLIEEGDPATLAHIAKNERKAAEKPTA